MTDVVVVESPAKAKTINKYLGDNFTVLASFGHVRDLPPKDGSVRPDQDFAMDWASDDRGQKQVSAIARALKGAKTLYLATDPDREGEAISWHVRAMLEESHALRGKTVHRITFNEVTKSAVRYAIEHPRDLDLPLIEAYMARRALDYLVGFTLSPILWRKLPGSRSAGRVQSVSLRLICEREAEIEAFRAREYWTVEAQFTTPAGAPFNARLTHLDGKRLDQFDLNDRAKGEAAKALVEAGAFSVASVERRRVKRNPLPPFTTSTLQQESSRKLGIGAQATMRLAQQLYEGVEIGGETTGLITYMRTDGVQMAREAINAARDHIRAEFGAAYVPGAPRDYQTKAKNAQEAHEACRPTDFERTPGQVTRYLSPDQARLYELIWKRSVASQMQSAELDQVIVDLRDRAPGAAGGQTMRANGSIVAFDGFLRLYRESLDDDAAEEDGRMLPPMAEADPLRTGAVTASQHFTQPPPRYSEASLVKKMEELGIGRPSTYASILSVLQDRNYVRLDKKRFIPEDRGRLVTAFLTSFFTRYVDVNFTAGLETQLDEISAGGKDWRAVMRAFWTDFSHAIEQTRDLKIGDVIDALDEDLGAHFFPARADGGDPRQCQACGNGRLGLKLGRHGSFIGCSNYPDCRFTRRLSLEADEPGADTLKEGMRELGHHPQTGEAVTVRRGPYGLYAQLGEAGEDKKAKPRRTSLPKGMDGDTMTIDQALGLLSLPRLIGAHPESGEPMEAGLGRFGPYVRMGGVFASLDPDDDVLVVGMNRAVEVLAKKLASVRSLGPHPKDGEGVTVRKGRFGPYAQHKTTVATLPRGVLMDEITLADAVSLLAERGKVLAPKGKKGAKPKFGAKAKGAPVKPAAPKAAKPPPGKRRKPRRSPLPPRRAPRNPPPARKPPAEMPGRRRDRKAAPPRADIPGLPSTEDLKSFVASSSGRVGKKEISRHFGLKPADRVALKGALRDLSAGGAIVAAGHRRFTAPGRADDPVLVEITGTDPDGDAIGRPVHWDGLDRPPMILMAPEPRGAPALAQGARVMARLRPIGPGKMEGRTVKRLEASPGRILGVFRASPLALDEAAAQSSPHRRNVTSRASGGGKEGRIVPVDRRTKAEWIVPAGEEAGAQSGEIVRAEPLPHTGYGLKSARIVERLGRLGDARSVSLICIAAADIPVDFAPEALAEATAAQPLPLARREDLRDLPLITIDGDDARDFDDAVWAAPDGTGFRMVVAIADVAAYVRPGSSLDRDAGQRGNSVYFPDRVVPMLPEALSNGWCSLRPHEDRGCLFVDMRIDGAGRKLAHRFGRGLMRSAARMTYEAVQAAEDAGSDAAMPPGVRMPLYAAYRALLAARRERGTLDLDLPERRVLIDEAGTVQAIVPRPRLDSHRLIEEFMVLANVAAAEELERLRQPCVYRVHAPPSLEKLANLRDFLSTLSIALPPGNTVHPRDLDRVLQQAAGTPHAALVNETVLRSQSQAQYDIETIGHFGLSLPRYAHFTSPIRRYADLLVHRALIRGLDLGAGALADADIAGMADTAAHITGTERRAALAERDAIDRYMAAYMQDKVGAVFAGRISGVTRFGLFVTLAETGASGIVPMSSLDDDFWVHDETAQALIGRRSRREYRLAQPVEVRLTEATPLTGGLAFQIVTGQGAGAPDGPSRRTQKPRGRRH